MNLEISHLVVNGCSFTYCQGIDNPAVDGWPALLGKMLGVPVVNLAYPGAGNDRIYRKTYDYFYKNKPYNNKPLYIIAFSSSERREEYYKTYRNEVINEYFGLNLRANESKIKSLNFSPDDYEVAHLNNLDPYICERKKLNYWAGTVNLLRANNTPYLTTDYFTTHNTKVVDWVQLNYSEIYKELYEDCCKLRNFAPITNCLPKTPCQHETEPGHRAIANYVFEFISNMYSKIDLFSCDYLKLIQTLNKYEYDRQNSNPWLYGEKIEKYEFPLGVSSK